MSPFSIGGSQTTETCESTGTSLLLSEDQETQVRYTYRILWTVSVIFTILRLMS